MTLFQALSRNIQRLQDAGSDEAALDVSLIAAHVLGISRSQLGTRYESRLSLIHRLRMAHLVTQRIKHKPVAHILGYRDFYRDRFRVSGRTLIPRPDTEHILYAMEELKKQAYRADRILDLGTGTGALALSARHIYPGACIDALDIDTRQVRINVRQLSARNINIIRADMLKWENPDKHVYDIILSNPPYLNKTDMEALAPDVKKYEPARALYGGQDGLLFYRDISQRAAAWMRPGALLLLEVDYKWEQIQSLFCSEDWEVQGVIRDYAGLERVLLVKKN